MSYLRTQFSSVKPRTVTYRVYACLLKGLAMDRLPSDLTAKQVDNRLARLRDDCGFVIWSVYTDRQALMKNGRKGKPYVFHKIIGRLDWKGGVSQDFTVPRD